MFYDANDPNSRKEYCSRFGEHPTYTVKRLRLANYMKLHDIEPINVHADYKNPKYNVYVYETSEKFLNLLYDWFVLGIRE